AHGCRDRGVSGDHGATLSREACRHTAAHAVPAHRRSWTDRHRPGHYDLSESEFSRAVAVLRHQPGRAAACAAWVEPRYVLAYRGDTPRPGAGVVAAGAGRTRRDLPRARSDRAGLFRHYIAIRRIYEPCGQPGDSTLRA